MLKANLSILALILLLIACQKPVPKDLMKDNIIPQPVSVTATNSSFEITEKISILVSSDELVKTGQYLADLIAPATGLELKVKTTAKAPKSRAIYLSLEDDLKDEAYKLDVTSKRVNLSAKSVAGLFYGIQTIRQLLPAKIELKTKQEGPWLLASGTIQDQPTYGYRGAMLDVSRHFFGVDDVKRFIDLMACYKLNVLHIHISDDQGWRIEIKSWPNLTAHGGSTQVGGGKGGFYTQEQYKDIVQYAMDRQITIIPEIDMPGHTNAALASYAELNCDEKATELYTGTEVGFSTLCTDKELTYKFIDDVVRELAAMTPGPYIHIGGDESHVTAMKDYIPFINRVQEIVKSHGKKVIGWDEIAHASLIENTVVQFWSKEENAKKGVDQGAKVLMSPAKQAYLDMQYDSTTTLGLHWAAYIEVDQAYNWTPETLSPGIQKENILGIESPLWSETVTNMDEIEYLVFPRLIGHAELGWSAEKDRNWDSYKQRLGQHGSRLEAMDVDFYQSKLIPWNNLK